MSMECWVAPLDAPDVADALHWFRDLAAPRYRNGHRVFGDARTHHDASWWATQCAEELADAAFYLRQVLRRLAPAEGRLRVYVAGPYANPSLPQQERNIAAAHQAMLAVYRRGHSPFCPHTMTAWCDQSAPDIPRTTYLRTDLDWLRLCHVLLLLPGWEQSEGAVAEMQEAMRLGLPQYHRAEDLPTVEEVLGWETGAAEGAD